MKRILAVLLFCFCAALATSMPLPGQATTVWEIGKLDQSNYEFKALAASHVDYQVGKSDWAREWPSEQRAGSMYDVRFDLGAVPRGVFTLKVSALVTYQRTPAVQIQINGHKGLYYVHPRPLYLGDQRFRFADELTIDIPANYLTKEANDLALSVVDTEAGAAKASVPAATLAYDYLCLVNNPDATYDRHDPHADVLPTIFYLQKDGKLFELVDAYLRFGQATPAGRVVLTVNGEHLSAAIAAQSDFGEERVGFEVPEWQGDAKARLELVAGVHRGFDVSLTASRKWTIFMVPHTHVDIGYTDYQGKVAETQANTLVEAADMIRSHPDFRFATDGSWNVKQLLESRSRAEQDDVIDLIRADKIGVPADYFNLLTGYASLETLYRSLYYTKSLSREYNLPFNYATTTDVPSYTGSYPSVLASAGVKYWAVGGNQDRAPVLNHEQWDEKSPFYWEGPDGNKVLFWYSHGYAQIGLFGNQQEATIRESLTKFLAAYNKPEYKPDAVLMYGAQGENTDLHPQLATFAAAWNQSYAYPRLQYATFADFFGYIEKKYGAELPTYKGDMGPYWEDGIGSDAFYAAEDRQNQSDALTSEIVSTVSHTVNPNAHPPKAELEDAWNNILSFAEHTWGAGNSISQSDSEEAVKQLAVKDNFATQASFELEDIQERSLAQLAHNIHIPARTLVVFNPLNWKRNALVETELRKNEELVDLTTHDVVPFEVMWTKENFLHVRFLAGDLPPVGYKCFQIRPVTGGAASEPSAENIPVIENQYYRITIDAESGAVRSIYDKQLQRELADASSPYRFGQYLYVTGGDPHGDGMNQMIHAYAEFPKAELTVHPASDGQYLGAEKTPWGYKIRLRSADVNTPAINLEILLYDNEKKIEFRYTVEKTYTTAKEGVYFAFPTSVASPEFAYGTQQGWVDPAHDLQKGACLEWFSIQKWMAVHGTGVSVGIVPIDASLASLGDINRGEWPGDFHPKSATLFSYAMNNYWHTNYRAGQGGTFTFRYVLTSAADFDPAALSRLGWESMESPALNMVINNDKVGDPDEPLPAEGTSFLEIDNPNVALVTWKLAEDGKGTILRLKEIAGQTEAMTVKLPRAKISSASLCNSVEDPLHDLEITDNAIHLNLHPHEVLTVRLIP